MSEPDAIVERYARRDVGDRYSILRPEVLLAIHERQQIMRRIFANKLDKHDLSDVKLLEVGCGTGGNLLEFLRFGMQPQNLSGIELLPERVEAARRILPTTIQIHAGDASTITIPLASQEVVFQSVVFSSLLDDAYQELLAKKMWSWVKPGGGILWYDFTYNNPSNPDVRGVPARRIRELFPEGKMFVRRVTLAPPLSRRICRVHPGLYKLFNIIPLLRTHVLCWIEK